MQNEEKAPVASPRERTLPSTDRMLRGMQGTLRRMRKVISDQQSLMELDMIDLMLSELSSRNQPEFFRRHYMGVRALLAEGMKLAGNRLAAADADVIRRELATTLPAALPDDAGFELANTSIHRAMRHLSTVVRSIHDITPALSDYLQRITVKEGEYYIHRSQTHAGRKFSETDGALHFTAETLQDYLRQKFPEKRGLRVSNFRQLVGGYQKITVLFETDDDSGEHQSLVLRSEKSDKFVALDASDICKEYEIVKFVYESGVTVAEPLWLEPDATKLGQCFFVSRKVAGENFGNAVVASKEMTEDVARSFVKAIARVHSLPTDPMRHLAIGRWLEFPDAQAIAREAVSFWQHQPWMKSGNCSAILDRLATWLIDNVPTDNYTPCLIHVDYGLHNVLVENGEVSAILDWESARIGDPADDLAWFLQTCGGKIDRSKVVEWYEEFTGNRISEYRLAYHDVWGCFKILVSCISAEAMYEATEEASVVWLIMPLSFPTHAAGMAEARIRAAEEARGR